ncbi:PREDICTED: methyltransferase-like protein 7A isoform X1 [Ceratosolen solmsi marchali]|uniref:Methyltransferase-like protein 7A isoform X1 n=1 Tax=Ceratosolen solmsi marchali TaxID=326594 RepID=A0AAJ6YKS9_9HYME|nr:PREDICTED: methyltransferase-like protein 7A isoform X1 [Ceratosolen solmsi marchali]
MSGSDLWIRDLITKYGLITIIIIIFSGLISWKWSRFRQHYFETFLLGFESECAELTRTYKKRLFAPLEKFVSHDETLRCLGRIRILEIGVKTGNNLQYYPDGTCFIAVDWNRKLEEYLINGDRSWQFTHIIFERFIIGDGSSLKEIPTGSVDAVVTTRSLCSTKSVSKTVSEIHRVLAPEGKYLFLEHLPDKQGSFIGWIQIILTKTKIWPIFFGGCQLNSDPTKYITKYGFKDMKWENITLQGYVSQPHHLLLTRHHIIGSATR